MFLEITEFKGKLPPTGALLAMDLGEKTIGLAASDISRMISSPLETIARGKFTKDVERLKQVVEEKEVVGFVLGYPLNMDGSLGPRAQATRAFVGNLEKHFTLPLLLWDERMTTMAVNRLMIDEADLSRARRAEIVDKMAACYMLQGVLDNLSNNGG